jgi:hypothetical protein
VHFPKGFLNGPLEFVLSVGRGLPLVFAGFGVEVADKICDHLGIGVAGEFHPFVPKPCFQRGVVLDDPIVNEGNLAAVVQVGMCVDRVGFSVGGPACVADAESLGRVGFFQYLFESADPAAALGDPYRATAQQRHACRVIAAIFQPFQSLCEDRLGDLLTEICYYAAHLLFTIGDLRAIIKSLSFFMSIG